MKKIILMLSITMTLFGWEINTHRAIDKEAILEASNLDKFKENSQIKEPYNENAIQFQTYGMTYIQYITSGEKGGMSEWGQKFNFEAKDKKANIQDLLEAGTILEDAVWSKAWFSVAGRFNNHFYDAQNGGKALTLGYGARVNAVRWAKSGYGSMNKYSFDAAQDWFSFGFKMPNQDDRRKYQAKMLVSVGHLMHMVNDMSVPAHTRDDSHPFGDPLEAWARGGKDGNLPIGFRVVDSTVRNYLKDKAKIDFLNTQINKQQKFTDFLTKEANWTATHFFSNDTILTKPKPSNEQVIKTEPVTEGGLAGGVKRSYYVYKNNVDGIPAGTKLAVHVETYTLIRTRAVIPDLDWMGMDSTTKFKGDYSVVRDNAKIILPRAIENAKNFLNYFFRGSMKVNSTDEVVSIINDSNENLVASPSVATFKNGTLKFYCDDKNYNRSEFHSEDIVDVTSGNELATVAKDTLYAEFKNKSCEKKNNVTILYDGTIGSERGLSVVVIPASDIIPQNGGDDNQNKVCAKDYFSGGGITEELQKGNKDEGVSDGTKHQVKELQTFLKAIGYDMGTSGANHDGLDGWFGGDTESGLKKFQLKNNIDDSGITDKQTRDVINRSSCHDKINQ